MPDAKPMAAQLEWTPRRSTTSKRIEAKIGTPRVARPRTSTPTGTHGSGNWRKKLRDKTYRPQAVRGIHSETEQQENATSRGSRRYATGLFRRRRCWCLEPIFEADLQPEQYAYRAGKNALDAVEAVNRLINFGHTAVVDADLRGYFR